MKGDPPKIDPSADQAPPDAAFLEGLATMIQGMRDFDEELRTAGVLLASEGLLPSWTGKRILVNGEGRRRVLDGPFSESKETIAGFYLIDVKSEAEAVEWAKRCPVDLAIKLFGGPGDEAELEVRQIGELPDDNEAAANRAVDFATVS